jgi:hypothetical protein
MHCPCNWSRISSLIADKASVRFEVFHTFLNGVTKSTARVPKCTAPPGEKIIQAILTKNQTRAPRGSIRNRSGNGTHARE